MVCFWGVFINIPRYCSESNRTIIFFLIIQFTDCYRYPLQSTRFFYSHNFSSGVFTAQSSGGKLLLGYSAMPSINLFYFCVLSALISGWGSSLLIFDTKLTRLSESEHCHREWSVSYLSTTFISSCDFFTFIRVVLTVNCSTSRQKFEMTKTATITLTLDRDWRVFFWAWRPFVNPLW